MKIISLMLLLSMCHIQALFPSQSCWQRLQDSCLCSWLFKKPQGVESRNAWLAECFEPKDTLSRSQSEHEMRSLTPDELKRNFQPGSPTTNPNNRTNAQAPSPESSPSNSPKACKQPANSTLSFPPPPLVAYDSPPGTPTYDQVEPDDYQLPTAKKPTTWWPF